MKGGRKTTNQVERRAAEGPGGERTKPGGSCCRDTGPRPMEEDRAGLMRLQRRGKLSEVSEVTQS